MVNMGQDQIRQIGYNPPPGKAGEVEVERVQTLLRRAGYHEFHGTRRLDFHFLLVVTEGEVVHMVDFADHVLREGSVLWMRPGQVQDWGDLHAFDGYSVIFPPGLLDAETDRLVQVESAHGPAVWSLEGRDWSRLRTQLSDLHQLSSDTSMPVELRRPALTHQLAALLLRLRAVEAPTSAAAHPDAYLAFRDLVESRFAEWHTVSTYAAELGYSPRTLARATRAATGRTPKQLVDDRILLEARRLLAHTDQTVGRIGAQLRFDDASNFTAWFEHRAGVLPSEFRRRARGS